MKKKSILSSFFKKKLIFFRFFVNFFIFFPTKHLFSSTGRISVSYFHQFLKKKKIEFSFFVKENFFQFHQKKLFVSISLSQRNNFQFKKNNVEKFQLIKKNFAFLSKKKRFRAEVTQCWRAFSKSCFSSKNAILFSENLLKSTKSFLKKHFRIEKKNCFFQKKNSQSEGKKIFFSKQFSQSEGKKLFLSKACKK